MLRGTNHFFDGQEAELVTTLDAWLADKTLP